MKNKELIDKKKCTGCSACSNICPNGCISMLPDHEGFLYPEIDESQCVNCGLCKKICPVDKTEKHLPFFVYGVKNRNDEERKNSTSGGVFSVLAQYVLDNKGVVFGCKFNKKLEVEHDYIESYENIDEFRGAKYVQSKINDAYKKAKMFLEKGRLVLFTGTPCQIAGLDAYLVKEYNNLIKCDLVCHSVPSLKIFKAYIDEIENKNNKKISKIWFRRKEMIGWNKSNIKVVFEDGFTFEELLRNTSFMKGFNKGLYSRPSCDVCGYKDFKGKSDITIADFWGIENVDEQFKDNLGVSLVFINTTTGIEIFNMIKNKIDFIETKIEDAITKNPFIVVPAPAHKNRNEFFSKIEKEEFTELVFRLLEEE